MSYSAVSSIAFCPKTRTWLSDKTDPRNRVFIQWGFSHFFPASTIAAHATKMGGRPLKFALDVAMSGALRLDLDVRKLSAGEKKTIAAAVTLYKYQLREIVAQGDLYRLESPYDGPRAALNYVSADRTRAVLFVYQLKANGNQPVKPRGLSPQRRYRLHEVNLPDDATSRLSQEGKIIDGATLMHEGLSLSCHEVFDTAVIEITDESLK